MRTRLLGDVLVRFKRMQGFNVLHPSGGDPFDVPEDFSPRRPGLSGLEEESRLSILHIKRALRALNGSPERQPRLHSWDKHVSMNPVMEKICAAATTIVVLDPKDLRMHTWQETSKRENLAFATADCGRFGADVMRAAVLFQAPVGETME